MDKKSNLIIREHLISIAPIPRLFKLKSKKNACILEIKIMQSGGNFPSILDLTYFDDNLLIAIQENDSEDDYIIQFFIVPPNEKIPFNKDQIEDISCVGSFKKLNRNYYVYMVQTED